MFRKLTFLLAVMAASSLGAPSADALTPTFNRTFVSNTGVSGNTAQGCSAASPCDTFANALSVTNSGGEINCLNSGDFGPVTITQAVTIDCEGVSNGGITASGVNAITVNTTAPVTLIGLDFNGMNVQGGNGVFIESNGNVNVRNCKIHGFLANGETTSGAGIVFETSSSSASLIVDNVLAAENTIGIVQASTGGGSNMTVRNSDISNSAFIGIAVAVNGGTHAGATIEQTMLAFDNAGGLLVESSGSGAVAVLGGSTIVNNSEGVITSGGVVYSFKNNQIGGNSTDGTPLTAYPGGPLN